MVTLNKGNAMIQFGLRVRVVKLNVRQPKVPDSYLYNRAKGAHGNIRHYSPSSSYAIVTHDGGGSEVAYWLTELDAEPIVLQEMVYQEDEPWNRAVYACYGDAIYFVVLRSLIVKDYQQEFEDLIRAIVVRENITLVMKYIAWHRGSLPAVDFHEVRKDKSGRLIIEQLEVWNLWGSQIGLSRRHNIDPLHAPKLVVKAFEDLFEKQSSPQGITSADSPQ